MMEHSLPGNLDSIVQQAEEESMGNAPEGVDPETWDSWGKWKTLPVNDFRYQVQRGMQGKNVGLGNGLKHINNYIYGTHQARYYLIGADSNCGKTTISDFMYILKAWESAKAMNRKIKIFYCSFEIGKTDKIARWCSYFIYLKFGEQMPSDYILGRITGKVPTKEHERMIMIAYDAVMKVMADVVFVEDVVHPTKIFEDLIEVHFEKVGNVKRREPTEEQKKKHRKGFVYGYEAKDPDMITMLVIDHLALTGSEQGLDTKHVMDRMSKYMVVLRNLFHCTGVFIQQFSTDLMSWHRTMKKTPQAVMPQRIDFGDSKATFRDADVVIGYVKPAIFDYSEFLGFPITGDESLGQCFIAQCLMKNRYGPSGRVLPLFLDGMTGHVYDLPLTPTNPFLLQPWINKAQKIEQLCQVYSPQENPLQPELIQG